MEELKNPNQKLVWALTIAIPLVTVLYILVNISYLLVLSPSEILSSDAAAVSWGNQVMGAWAWLTPLAVVLSTFGSANGTFFSGSRVCYVAAREDHMIRDGSGLGKVVGAAGGVLEGLKAKLFLAWLTNGTTISCLLYLRIKKKNLPRPYKVPTIIPVITLLASLYLVLAPIIDHPPTEFPYIFLFLLSGFLVYFLFVYFWCQPKCLQMATLHLQLLLEVAPTTKNVK
ncbi:hypothetical protein HPG69_008405 [Diceros bicornis minor]|uniref:B(0,+)-type amino acid transporter 1 n=1 Tax=Diceros bicornis minor TaxID=77932 RepID=A0A7J7ENR9_DICBM|nr:hypothetical protein HPG69_008405 [Diceros bicornis minor]